MPPLIRLQLTHMSVNSDINFTNEKCCVRFEVSTAVTTSNAVFWDVTLCGSCKNRHFGGT
jgi:hypothetical protein